MNAIAELDERALILSTGSNIPQRLARRQVIRQAQEEIAAMPENLGENAFPLDHKFAHGVYKRQVFLPKGSLVIGKIHRFDHFTLISVGHVLVFNERGIFDIVGPHIQLTQAGTQNVVYAMEDTLWSTFHGTQNTDADVAEDELSTKNYEELEPLT